jgi:uncharacterized membrane protein
MESEQAVRGPIRGAVIFLDRMIYQLALHWLALVNFAVGLYVGLPILAPVLLAEGYETPANIIYAMYKLVCHQLPSRSEFINGQQVAMCERDIAIYGGLLVTGLAFATFRKRLKPLSLWAYLLFVVPIALDGGTQLIGLRQSNLVWRSITGFLFGFGSVWLAYPYAEEAFNDVRRELQDKLNRL